MMEVAAAGSGGRHATSAGGNGGAGSGRGFERRKRREDLANLVREGRERAARKQGWHQPRLESHHRRGQESDSELLDDGDDDDEDEEEEKRDEASLQQQRRSREEEEEAPKLKEDSTKKKSRSIKTTFRKTQSRREAAENASSSWEDPRATFAWVQGFWEGQVKEQQQEQEKQTKTKERRRRGSTKPKASETMTSEIARTRSRSVDSKRVSTRHGVAPAVQRRKGSLDRRTKDDGRRTSAGRDVGAVASSLGSIVSYVGTFFDPDAVSPRSRSASSRSRSSSSWREAYTRPAASRPSLSRPSWADRITVFKQRVFHGDTGESPELQTQFEAIIGLRSELENAQARLDSQVEGATTLLSTLAEHEDAHGRNADPELNKAVEGLEGILEEVRGFSYFADVIAEIDAALDYRKRLKHHRRAWARQLRKAKNLLETVTEEEIDDLPLVKRKQLDDAISAQERYDEATSKVSEDMANLLSGDNTESPITDELHEAQFLVFMSWRSLIREQRETFPERAQRAQAAYQATWAVYARDMSTV
ncbi:Hypothetical Protein FCC1311_074332 [Hondaea fermentalgiana]|uniref:Uncharacterized protein n=1 Tax=Hondaea fermentalgiana TaxID=2315210 RepID=A0A2R5GJY9_9STRA|nr:Hypothetical Protein FCC1311_074332 [Hondaea fermentalgiana]|eukprot:GBG31212.1 Hypothetical Protein FCC1311_074332 [Hondaea fermentalgiana]